MVERDPRRPTRCVEQGVENGPIRNGVRPVAHALGLAIPRAQIMRRTQTRRPPPRQGTPTRSQSPPVSEPPAARLPQEDSAEARRPPPARGQTESSHSPRHRLTSGG